MKIQGFLLDECPRFGENYTELKDDPENPKSPVSRYELKQIKGNGCVLTVNRSGAQVDQVMFSPQDLRALYLLLHVNRK